MSRTMDVCRVWKLGVLINPWSANDEGNRVAKEVEFGLEKTGRPCMRARTEVTAEHKQAQVDQKGSIADAVASAFKEQV